MLQCEVLDMLEALIDHPGRWTVSSLTEFFGRVPRLGVFRCTDKGSVRPSLLESCRRGLNENPDLGHQYHQCHLHWTKNLKIDPLPLSRTPPQSSDGILWGT